MNHLEWHNHAFLDKDNIVVNVAVFDESAHDTDLIEQIKEANGWAKAVCCCAFGIAGIGDTWDEATLSFIIPQAILITDDE